MWATGELRLLQRRLDRQAEATRHLRMPLYERAAVPAAGAVLDVGCGSGAVTQDLDGLCRGKVVGVDVDPRMARRGREAVAGPVVVADGARLPFPDATFDVAVCNLVLMWARDPAGVVREMARVVRPGGRVLASMEPDHGGKVHWPENPLADLVFREDGIRARGADPHAGRKLRHHFVAAGLRTEVGLANPDPLSPEQDLEVWQRERHVYRRMLRRAGSTAQEIDRWEQEYEAALSDGIQLSWLPFFWALGRKPVPGDVDRP